MKNSSTAYRRRPLRVPCRRLFFAFLLSCVALRSSPADASIFAWGNNNNLQAQVPASLTNAAALAGGILHSLALKPNGTVVAWGDNLFGQTNVTAGLSGVMAIAAGGYHSLALKSNGTVVVWGDRSAVPAGLTRVTAISAGWEHDLALTGDGTIVAWGAVSNVPPGLSNIVAVAAGEGHSLALRADGRVVGWGDNAFGETDVPPSATNVVAIAAGKDHSLALRRDGKVIAWGGNYDGQADVPAGLSNVAAIVAGAYHSLALKADGTLVAWGSGVFNQTAVPPWAGFYVLAAGAYHNLALLGDGSPAILVQPASQSVRTTGNATIHVTAAGAPPLRFQWRREGTNLVGKTNATLTLSNVQMSDVGAYSVVVANGLGSATSRDAILTPLTTPPFVTAPLQDQSAYCGDPAVFKVTADGSTPLSYQWQFEGTEILDATNASLILTELALSHAGGYSVIVTNEYGAVTSAVATLTVLVNPPLITSPLEVSGAQGQFFNYTITGEHNPTLFSAARLPLGLGMDPASGVISGIPLQNGTFSSTIAAFNECASHTETLTLTFDSSAPVITSPPIATGTENQPLSYQITADRAGNFGAQNLPIGLSLDTATGTITGTPVFAGTHQATIFATNEWGMAGAPLTIIVTNRVIEGLAIANVTYTYSSPYLLDFEFSLRDNTNASLGNAVVVPPQSLVAIAMEAVNDVRRTNSTSETGVRLALGNTKQLKVNLVLDFSESVANLATGDSNGDGISDAVEQMVASAQLFVNQQSPGTRIGVYEFHREDIDPQQVVPLTTDKRLLNESIAGIWTNYVQFFPASSRCWDALNLAIEDLGADNLDEQHYVVFISDGEDESSLSTIQGVINLATNNGVKVFCIGFGDPINTDNLTNITESTRGRYYPAADAVQLGEQFALVSKDLLGQYVLRWATLKRGGTPFLPSFIIRLGTHEAVYPEPPGYTWYDEEIVDPDTGETNTVSITNYVFAPNIPTAHAGPVSVGLLRLTPDAAVEPTAMTLRAAYVPRFVRQLRINYRANWPCAASLLSTGPGEILYGWGMTETNDEAGGKWMLLSNPNPQSTLDSIPFASFGDLVRFHFQDVINPSNAFSLFAVDNTLYTNTGGQSFAIENTNAFITVYTNLAYQTPVPWLIANGITNDFALAELDDPDGDGMPTWQEYHANTHPLDPDSRFIVRGLSNDVYGRYQITFGTAVNRRYRVETSFDLVNWDNVAADISGTGAEVTVLDSRYQPWITQVFYRAIVY